MRIQIIFATLGFGLVTILGAQAAGLAEGAGSVPSIFASESDVLLAQHGRHHRRHWDDDDDDDDDDDYRHHRRRDYHHRDNHHRDNHHRRRHHD